jgi:polyisoprenoid-binding protein YceI
VKRLKSGNLLEDREMLRRINARRYPTIDGAVTAAVLTGDNGEQRVRGDVTFRGETRSCEDVVTVTVDEDSVLVDGRSTFDIREFGMEPPHILLLRVDPDVEVQIAISAEREDEPTDA